jgi:Organic solute transporter Ostalpha
MFRMQAWAVYCLVSLYKATCSELADIHPLRKFVIIKMVVFFSFWQGFLLSILGSFKLIGTESVATYDTKALAGSIQDVLICVECLPASLAFANAFPARDYMGPGQQPGTVFENIVSMFDVRDLGHDMSELVEDQVCNNDIRLALACWVISCVQSRCSMIQWQVIPGELHHVRTGLIRKHAGCTRRCRGSNCGAWHVSRACGCNGQANAESCSHILQWRRTSCVTAVHRTRSCNAAAAGIHSVNTAWTFRLKWTFVAVKLCTDM